ncbi:MAG: single-stranded DNA-binding protein, partial [Finegoldia sp.]|nr:single-stranded DNA-binding protein [Finegoldia sp.]
MNKVILTGRLTRDIDLMYTRSSTPTASFSLAVDKGLSREKRQEAEANNRPTADFPRVVVFGRQAENAARYLAKGSRCLIEGRIQTGSYQDKDGKTI